MAKQTISTLKNWFKTGLEPTQQQFWDWLDSYRHKDDKVPSADVDGLQDLLDAKVDKKDVVDPEVWDNAKPYVYDSDNQKYVSFLNPNSEDTQFKNEGFYRLLANTAAGESPETHPAKWAYQGTVIGDITINDVIGLSEELGNKADLVAGKVPAEQLPELGGSGSALPLAPATITLWPEGDYRYGQVKTTVAAYYDDATKHLEQRFDWNADLSVSKIEIKDELTGVWVQRDYTWTFGIPTVSETIITAWTIN